MIADVDRLTTITVIEPGMDHNAIRPKVQALCGERAEIVVLENQPNMLIKNRIKMYLREQSEDDNYVDFVCVGNRGLNVGSAADGDNYMGTVASSMIAMRQLNVIFMPWTLHFYGEAHCWWVVCMIKIISRDLYEATRARSLIYH